MPEPHQPSADFFVAGGTLSAEAVSYVEREADAHLFEALVRGEFCYVLNSRQMGKSSICVRTMRRLDGMGTRPAFVDLTKVGGRNVTVEQWYAGIAMELGRALGLRSEVLVYWKENSNLSGVQRLFGALREVVLDQIDGPVAIFFDEIDATRSLGFSADEFFAAIRESYNRRVIDPALGRLTFCLLGVALASDLINDPAATPFNVGERIVVRDFTLDESMAFAAGLRHGRTEAQAAGLVRRVFHWTNGHPYLTQSLCRAIAADPSIVAAEAVDELVRRELLEASARETNINLADVSNRALHVGDAEPEPERFRADLLSGYDLVLRGKRLLDDESNRVVAVLKLAGLMRQEGNRLVVRNLIYRTVFDRQWIRENMPGQELRRQRQSYWLGALRTAFVGALVILLVSVLAIRLRLLASAYQQLAAAAQQAEHVAEYHAYVADLNAMRTADSDKNFVQLGALLADTRVSPFRGIEWDYWNDLLHNSEVAIPFPPNEGSVQMAPDGASVAVTDRRTYVSSIYTFPDLKQLFQAPTPKATDELVWLGGKWARLERPSLDAFRLVDVATGRPIGSAAVPGAAKIQVHAAEGGSGLVVLWTTSLAAPNNRLTLYNLALHAVASLAKQGDFILSARGSLDGKYALLDLAKDYNGPCHLAVANLATGKAVASFPVSNEYPTTIALSGDGRLAAMGTVRGRLTVYDVAKGRAIYQVRPFLSAVTTLAFSADGGRLLAQGDQTVMVFDAQGRQLCSQPGGSDCAMAPDGQSFIVTGVGTRTFAVKPPPISSRRLTSSPLAVIGIGLAGLPLTYSSSSDLSAVDPNTLRFTGLRVVCPPGKMKGNAWWRCTTVNDAIDVVATDSSVPGCTLTGVAALPQDMAATRDRSRIVAVDATWRTIRAFDGAGRALWTHAEVGRRWTNCWISADGRLVTALTTGDEVAVLDAANGRPLRTFEWPNAGAVAAFSNHGHLFAFATGNDIRLLNLDSNEAERVFAGHSGSIRDLDFSPDDARLATASLDGTVRIWDTAFATQLLRLGSGKGACTSAVFGPHGTRLYWADDNGALTVSRFEPIP